MIEKRTKILLIVFLSSLGIFFVLIGSSIFFEYLNDINQKISQYEINLSKLKINLSSEDDLLKRKNELADKLKNEKSKFYLKDETDIYKFGEEIRLLLRSYNIQINRLQMIEKTGTKIIEFSCTGSILNTITFLKVISEYKKFISVPYLFIKLNNKTQKLEILIRIGYEIAQ